MEEKEKEKDFLIERTIEKELQGIKEELVRRVSEDALAKGLTAQFVPSSEIKMNMRYDKQFESIKGIIPSLMIAVNIIESISDNTHIDFDDKTEIIRTLGRIHKALQRKFGSLSMCKCESGNYGVIDTDCNEFGEYATTVECLDCGAVYNIEQGIILMEEL